MTKLKTARINRHTEMDWWWDDFEQRWKLMLRGSRGVHPILVVKVKEKSDASEVVQRILDIKDLVNFTPNEIEFSMPLHIGDIEKKLRRVLEDHKALADIKTPANTGEANEEPELKHWSPYFG